MNADERGSEKKEPEAASQAEATMLCCRLIRQEVEKDPISVAGKHAVYKSVLMQCAAIIELAAEADKVEARLTAELAEANAENARIKEGLQAAVTQLKEALEIMKAEEERNHR